MGGGRGAAGLDTRPLVTGAVLGWLALLTGLALAPRLKRWRYVQTVIRPVYLQLCQYLGTDPADNPGRWLDIPTGFAADPAVAVWLRGRCQICSRWLLASRQRGATGRECLTSSVRSPPVRKAGSPLMRAAAPGRVWPGAARWVDGHGVRWMVTVGVLPGTTVA